MKFKVNMWVEFESRGKTYQGKVSYVDARKHTITVKVGKTSATISDKRAKAIVDPVLTSQLKFGDSRQVSALKYSGDVLGQLECEDKKRRKAAAIAEVEQAQLSLEFGEAI
jgi:hypothetical protein